MVTLKTNYETKHADLKRNESNFKLLEYFLLKNRLVSNPSDYSQHIPNDIGHLELFNALNQTLGEQIRNVIVCSFNSNNLNIINLNTNVLVKTLKGHTEPIKCFVIYQLTKVISGSEDKSIKIWDLNSSKCLQTLLGHTGVVSSLLLLKPNLDCLASGSIDKTIKIWSLTNFTCLFTLVCHFGQVLCLDQIKENTHGSNFLLSGLFNGSIRVWNVLKQDCVRVIRGHVGGVSCLKVLLDRNLFASGSWDRLIKIWNVCNGQCVKCLDELPYSILDLELLSHSNKLISCSGDLTLRMWDLNTFSCEIISTNLVTSLKVSQMSNQENDDMLVCASYYDKSIRVWDLRRGECLSKIKTDFEILKLVFTSIN